MHKALTGCIDAKKLLSRQRQSDYWLDSDSVVTNVNYRQHSLLPRLSFCFVCERPHGALQNLWRLRRKTRCAHLLLSAASCAFGAQYSCSALVVYVSQTELNRVFDKDYRQHSDYIELIDCVSPCCLQMSTVITMLSLFSHCA